MALFEVDKGTVRKSVAKLKIGFNGFGHPDYIGEIPPL